MTKKSTSFNVSAMTRRQLRELATALGVSQGQVLTLAIDRMHQQENRTMQNPYAVDPSNPTEAEADAMAILVYDAAYPDPHRMRDMDEVAYISEWLRGPGGWADYAEPDSLAAEWLQVQAEAEEATN